VTTFFHEVSVHELFRLETKCGGFKSEVERDALLIVNRKKYLPQSGFVSEPRVAATATLGQQVSPSNRNAVAPSGHNPFRVD